jgi:hypothetical protein
LQAYGEYNIANKSSYIIDMHKALQSDINIITSARNVVPYMLQGAQPSYPTGYSLDAGSRTMVQVLPTFEARIHTDTSGRPNPRGIRSSRLTFTSGSFMFAMTARKLQQEFIQDLVILIAMAPQSGGLASLPTVNAAGLQTLNIMGFDVERASCALAASNNDVAEAVHWLQENRQVSTEDMLSGLALGMPLMCLPVEWGIHI